MKKTDYTIVKNDGHYTALKNGKVIAHNLHSKFTLQAIWVEEGSRKDEYYYLDDSVVFLKTRKDCFCKI